MLPSNFAQMSDSADLGDAPATTGVPVATGRRQRRRSARSTSQRPRLVVASRWRALAAALPSWQGAGLFAVVLVSVLAVGSVHGDVVLALAPFALTLALVVALRGRVRSGFVPWVLFGLGMYSLLQAVPFPVAWTRIVTPAVDVWTGALSLTDASEPRFLPVSLDPGASLVEAVKWSCYAAVFIVAGDTAQRLGLNAVLRFVFASAVIVAGVTLAHKATDATRLYGFYAPEFASPQFALSPLLNPNNLAGYLNLGALTGVGLIVSSRTTGSRGLLALGVTAVVAVSMLSGSRGGWAALALAVPLAFGALALVKSPSTRRARRLILPAVALVGGLALFALASGGQLLRSAKNEGLEKLDLISWSRGIIGDYAWTGVGRGAFETSFAAYRGDHGRHIYAHAENFVAQWCAEWGVPIAVSALVALAWGLRPSRLGARQSAAAACAVVGIAMLTLQNLVDLSFELFSVSLAVVTVLGAMHASARVEPAETTRPGHGRLYPMVVAGAAVLALACWVGAVSLGRSPAIVERRALSNLTGATSKTDVAGQRAIVDRVRAAIARHPADAFFPYLGAVATYRAGGDAVPWINRALERDPNAGRPLLLLAHVLAARGALDQALLSAQLAVERDYSLVPAVHALVSELSPTPEAFFRAAPEGVPGSAVLHAFARSVPGDADPALRRALLAESVVRDPTRTEARLLLVRELLGDLEKPGPKCVASAEQECLRQVRALCAYEPFAAANPHEAAICVARALLEEGRAADALAALTAACQAKLEHAECLRWRIVAADRASASPSRVVEEYLEAACKSAEECRRASTWLGQRAFTAEDWGAATEHFERAARDGGDAASWERLARAAMRAGRPGLATRALQRAEVVRSVGGR